jgi:hypothetical protein
MKHYIGLRGAIAATVTACVILVGGTTSASAQSLSAGRADGQDGQRDSSRSDAEARRQAEARERADAARQAAEERQARIAAQMQAIQDNNARNQEQIRNAGNKILNILQNPTHASNDDDELRDRGAGRRILALRLPEGLSPSHRGRQGSERAQTGFHLPSAMSRLEDFMTRRCRFNGERAADGGFPPAAG